MFLEGRIFFFFGGGLSLDAMAQSSGISFRDFSVKTTKEGKLASFLEPLHSLYVASLEEFAFSRAAVLPVSKTTTKKKKSPHFSSYNMLCSCRKGFGNVYFHGSSYEDKNAQKQGRR